MLSTLYGQAEAPPGDSELLRWLRYGLTDRSDNTATMYRLGIANDAGAVYRFVIVFGVAEREQVLTLLERLGYSQGAPQPERGLDAVYRPRPRAVRELLVSPMASGLMPGIDPSSNKSVFDAAND